MHTLTPTRPGIHMHALTRKHAHTDRYVMLLFHCNSCFVNVPQCYVTRTLPVLFILARRSFLPWECRQHVLGNTGTHVPNYTASHFRRLLYMVIALMTTSNLALWWRVIDTNLRVEQDRQCACNVALRRVRVTNIAVGKQYVLNIMNVCL
jgi:hypothetical protein